MAASSYLSKQLFSRSTLRRLHTLLSSASSSSSSFAAASRSSSSSSSSNPASSDVSDADEFIPNSEHTISETTYDAGDDGDGEGDGNGGTVGAGTAQGGPRRPFQRPLENGLDPGVYKAILVGKVGQQPVQKQLRSGRTVVLFSVGTGGIRNNRRPLDNEEPRDYAARCAVQWHRVSVYPPRLGSLALKHVKPGSILYLEGNLETKVFSDPITGLVRRIREVAIRGDGRFIFLGNGSETAETEQEGLRNVGYY